MSKKAEGFSLRFVLINTGNISRKVLSKVLRSFDKNFERLHSVVPLKVGLWEQAKTRNQEVISNVSLDPISGTRIIERFAPRPYYFASEDEDLLKEVDEAISIIKQV